jgi:ribose 5-phosphate isomerase B
MIIALASDEPYPVHATIRQELERRGHSILPFGAIASGSEAPWAEVAEEAAEAVARGQAHEGVFLCWSGTGICMAANKVPGIRAALCTDPGTAVAARVWNHANVLCLSHRTLSDDMAKELLEAWFRYYDTRRGAPGVEAMSTVDARHRRQARN